MSLFSTPPEILTIEPLVQPAAHPGQGNHSLVRQKLSQLNSPSSQHSLMKTAATILAVTSLAASLAPSVEAHGYIAFPHAQYKNPAKATDYNAIITESINTAFKGKKWNDNPVANTKTFTAAFKKSGYTSLRQMVDKKVPGCQNSRTDFTPINVKGFKNMEWQNDYERKGFVDSHHVRSLT